MGPSAAKLRTTRRWARRYGAPAVLVLAGAALLLSPRPWVREEPLAGRPGTVALRFPARVDSADVSPDGRLLACGLVEPMEERRFPWLPRLGSPQGNAIVLYDIGRHAVLRVFHPCDHNQRVRFSPDGRLLVGRHYPFDRPLRSIAAWEVSTGRRAGYLDVRLGPGFHCLEFSPDGRRLAIGGPDGVALYDTITWRLDRRFRVPNIRGVLSLAFPPDGRQVAALAMPSDRIEQGGVLIWNTHTGRRTGRVSLRSFGTDVDPVLFIGSGGNLLCGQHVFDLRAPGCPGRRVLPISPRRWIAPLAATGALFISEVEQYSPAHSVELWNVAAGKRLRRWQSAGEHVLGFSTRRKLLLSSQQGSDVILQPLRYPRVSQEDTAGRQRTTIHASSAPCRSARAGRARTSRERGAT